jgi:hypothetical protein
VLVKESSDLTLQLSCVIQLTHECQSFLDNLIAGSAQIGAWNDPCGIPAASLLSRIPPTS